MRVISASEANQQFSKLLSAAENGEEVVITRRRRAVVRMVPASAAADDDAVARDRRVAAFRASVEQNRAREHQILRGWTRDSLYDRDDRTAEG